MQLRHAVITSVDRDDLPDFGAYIFAETIRQIHERAARAAPSKCSCPTFRATRTRIRAVLEARPEIYNHNTETVPRLYKKARPGGRYERVMKIFRIAKRIAPDIPTKTGIILGLGETNEEVVAVMQDLRAVDVDILTLGQYLRPSDGHIALDRYVTPEEFRWFCDDRHEHGLPARGERTAGALELPRLGAGAGRRRLSTARRSQSAGSVHSPTRLRT